MYLIGKFRVNITALSVLAPYARYKVWIKPNGGMFGFLRILETSADII